MLKRWPVAIPKAEIPKAVIPEVLAAKPATPATLEVVQKGQR
jgi:hypothetical protein